ncbi:MAG: FMN-binding protein [Firmicutes bacterium]|nr:FMN-binding protein [Bacillota bacterium]
MKKRKRRPLFWVLISALGIILLLAAVFFSMLPKPQSVSDANFALAELTDGLYQGACDNGLVFAKVEVEIQNHAIAGVRILEHRNGMGQAAEVVADRVTDRQSLKVDGVSGATYSSQTLLKAIENALSHGNAIVSD